MVAIRIRENYSISDNQFVGTHGFVNYKGYCPQKVCLSLVLRIFQFTSYFPKYSLGVRPVIFLKRRVK